ncbi:hypothetical protein H0G86_001670 [Trichoderma simmonsii]|uniref:Uncharacterized protein n=1 Tax=Trichoderma simmonsii TaxID=1491479 RepID=A0A8G0L4A1_9HYPO|nr:hypothetical protein H0G86_001670 [Trichoderma simmonsii]
MGITEPWTPMESIPQARVPAWLRVFRSNLSAKVRQGTKRDASSGVASEPMTKKVLLKHIQQHVPGCWTLGVDMACTSMEMDRYGWYGLGLRYSAGRGQN